MGSAKTFFFVALFFGFAVSGCVLGGPAERREFFEQEIQPGRCRQIFGSLRQFQWVFDVSGVDAFVEDGKTGKLTQELSGWSSDLLIKVILQAEQEFGARCRVTPKLQALLQVLKKSYLKKLGLTDKHFERADVDLLFRGLLVLKPEVAGLQKQFQKAKLKSSRSALQMLKAVYQQVDTMDDVLVVAKKRNFISKLKSILKGICGRRTQCLFWNPRLIYRVVITPEEKAAAYIPEMAILVISEELLEDPNLLHKIVILHELAHVAERGARLFHGKQWKKEFAKFSGWDKDKKGNWSAQVKLVTGKREDELTQLSQYSFFSILPDPIYVGKKMGGKSFDGFVLGKSYEEVIKSKDVSEDLADHIAVFHYYPKRFCYQEQNIAPRKFTWIIENVFGGHSSVKCKTEYEPTPLRSMPQ